MLFLRCTLSLYTTHFLSTLLEYYTRIILDRMDSLQEVSKVLIADAYFSKRGFVESFFQNGFTVISRLRDDADLQYLYKEICRKQVCTSVNYHTRMRYIDL